MDYHVRGHLDDYIAEALDGAARRAFEQHVAACSGCRAALGEAKEAQECMALLASKEPPPQPGPDFYYWVRQSIDQQQRSLGWLSGLAVALHPRLAYPLILLVLLMGAWTLTYENVEADDGLIAMEFPDTEFTRMLSSNPSGDRALGQDLVMMTLVDLPDEEP
jgi:hypothetical protein